MSQRNKIFFQFIDRRLDRQTGSSTLVFLLSD